MTAMITVILQLLAKFTVIEYDCHSFVKIGIPSLIVLGSVSTMHIVKKMNFLHSDQINRAWSLYTIRDRIPTAQPKKSLPCVLEA